MTGDMNDVMPGSAEDLGDLKKKQSVEILNSERESRFSELAEARSVVCGGGAARVGVQMEKSA